MWFLIPIVCIAAFVGSIAIPKARRLRQRERRMVLAELRDFARRAEDPAQIGEMRFTAPLCFREDRSHETMFTVRHGSRGLAFILDTSRARIRWWVLAEWYAPDGSRSARFEATFIESAIPTRDIQILLKAARGELPAPPPAETTPPPPAPDLSADPVETSPDTTAQA
jgi:hypothetical protein